MNHDCAAGIHSRQSGAAPIRSTWIGDVQGAVEATLLVPAIDEVMTFGSALVSFMRLGRKTAAPKRDMIRPNDFAVLEEFKQVIVFEDHDGVSLFGSGWLLRTCRDLKTGRHCKNLEKSKLFIGSMAQQVSLRG